MDTQDIIAMVKRGDFDEGDMSLSSVEPPERGAT